MKLIGTVKRTKTSDQATTGVMQIGSFSKVTLELPDRGNATGRSCILAGTYLFKRHLSPSHGLCLMAWDDPATPANETPPNRSLIQIHAANLAGDIDKGYVSQLLGCIAVGQAVSLFTPGNAPAGKLPQIGIVGSKSALKELLDLVGDNILELTITWNL